MTTFFDTPVLTKVFKKQALVLIQGQLNKVFVLNEMPYELTGDIDEVNEYLEENNLSHQFEINLSKSSKVQVRPVNKSAVTAIQLAQKKAIEAWIDKLQVAKLRGYLSNELIHNFLNKLGAPVKQLFGEDALADTDKILQNFETYNSAEFVKGQLRIDMLELKKIMTEDNYLPSSIDLAQRVNRYKAMIAAKDAANQILADREANYLPDADSVQVAGQNLIAEEKRLKQFELSPDHNRVLLIEADVKKTEKAKAKYYATKTLTTEKVNSLISELKVAQLLGKDNQVTQQGRDLINNHGLTLHNASTKQVIHTYQPVSQ